MAEFVDTDLCMDEISIFFFGVSLALACLFILIANFTPKLAETKTSQDNTEILQMLINKQATFFGASWCGFTQKQFDELGISAEDTRGLDYVECASDDDRCVSENVEAFPTWKIDGQLYPGFQELSKLKMLLQN